VLSTTSAGVDGQTAALLAEAAEVYGNPNFYQAAVLLADATELLPGIGLDDKISELRDIADQIETASRRMGDM